MEMPPISHWGVEARLQPLVGGHRHRVFRTTGAAPDLVFKTTDRSEAAVAWLVPVLQIARNCGLVVPKMIPTQAGTWCGAGWTCETFLEGHVATTEDRASLKDAFAAFHKNTLGRPQRPDFRDARSFAVDAKGGDIDLSVMPPAIVTACRAAWHAGVSGAMGVVHGDLSLGNLIRRPDGRIAVIDWDECRCDAAVFDRAMLAPATPAQTRALLAWEVACCWTLEPDRARHLAKTLMSDAAR